VRGYPDLPALDVLNEIVTTFLAKLEQVCVEAWVVALVSPRRIAFHFLAAWPSFACIRSRNAWPAFPPVKISDWLLLGFLLFFAVVVWHVRLSSIQFS
jgi:hypothetical protein